MRNGPCGSKCSLCEKDLLPSETIKVKFLRLSEGEEGRTGVYKSIGKMDLCSSCYRKVFTGVVEEINSYGGIS